MNTHAIITVKPNKIHKATLTLVIILLIFILAKHIHM